MKLFDLFQSTDLELDMLAVSQKHALTHIAGSLVAAVFVELVETG